jgi:branched-subunit amino acid ABC-type transport system permease component
MHLVLQFALSLPSWTEEQSFVVTGLALGGVYALSGVGMIVLYRTTGVLNLSFGAVGAFGALIAWQLINHSGMNEWLAYLVCIVVAAIVIGLISALLTPIASLSNYRDMTPFVLAAIALLILNRRRTLSLSRQEF